MCSSPFGARKYQIASFLTGGSRTQYPCLELTNLLPENYLKSVAVLTSPDQSSIQISLQIIYKSSLTTTEAYGAINKSTQDSRSNGVHWFSCSAFLHL